MNNRIIKLNVNDIIIDHRNAADLINRKCFGNEKMEVAGAYLKSGNLLVWLEALPENADRKIDEYILSPLKDPSEQSILAEVTERFCYGFSTITFFEINDKLWGLFARKQTD